jgi:hypothetical protein
MIILGHDPGFANYANIIIEWTPRTREVRWHETIKTKPKQPDAERWSMVCSSIRRATAYLANWKDRLVACESMSGVRAGKNRAGHANQRDDSLLEVQGAIRQESMSVGIPFYLIEPKSSIAAIGSRIYPRPGESDADRQKRQKAQNARQVRLLLAGAEDLTEHEYDACAHAIGVALGKGRRA